MRPRGSPATWWEASGGGIWLGGDAHVTLTDVNISGNEAGTRAAASGPEASTAETSASFSFRADEAGSSFECKLDDGAFEP